MHYHIFTIGCQMNKADSERIASYLEENNYIETLDFTKADLIVFNTCGIRQSAEDRVYGLVARYRKLNPRAKIVLTGCLSQRKDTIRRLRDRVDLFMPINELPNLLELLNRLDKSSLSYTKLREINGEKYLGIVPKHQSNFSAYLPIGNGCDNFCSYCVVPYARGREVYRDAKEIIQEAKDLIKRGYKEIILIAQNVNSYKSNGYDFSQLLSELSSFSGDYWIRFSSSHPKDLSDNLIKVLASSDKICSHLHLAMQSGDDEILKRMNRNYTAKDFKELIEKIRLARPGISITTDIIVGYPQETKEQFNNTLKLFQELKFEMAYISRYSPRPGTASWNLADDVEPKEKQRREEELNNVLIKTSRLASQNYLNKKLRVLVEGKRKDGKYYGKSSSFRSVIFQVPEHLGDADLIGEFVDLKIIELGKFGLLGAYEA